MGLFGLKLPKKVDQVFGGVARQVNPFDNGQTYKQQTPVTNRSVLQQVANNGLVRNVAQPFVGTGKAIINTPAMLAADITNNPIAQRNIQQRTFGTTNQGNIAKQIIGNTAGVGLTVGAPGLSKVIEGGVAKVLPATVPKLAQTLVPKVASNAAIGSGFNASATAAQGGNAKEIAQSAALGGVLGGALPIAGLGAKAGGRVIVKTAQQAKPLNEAGFAKLPSPSPLSETPVAPVNRVNRPTGVEQGSAIDKTLTKIMRQENIGREEATKRMDQLLRESSAPNQTLSGAPEGSVKVISGKVHKDPDVRGILQSLSRAQRQANAEQSLTSATIERAARKHGVSPDNPDFIERFQTGNLTAPNEQQFANEVRKETDRILGYERQINPATPRRENYLPGVYQQDQPTVENAIRQFRSKTGNDISKKFETYKEASGFGLSPRYNKLSDLLGVHAGRTTHALATKNAVMGGLEKGILSVKPEDMNWRQVEGLKVPNGQPVFAQGDVANRINSTFQKPDEALGKNIERLAVASKIAQEVALTGGIPNTYFNAFGIAQANTQALGYLRPSVVKDLYYSGSKDLTQKRFTSPTSVVKGLSTPDFIRAVIAKGGNINPIRSSAANANSGGLRKFGNVASGQEATFAQLMPNFQLSIAEASFKKYAKRGQDKALQIAADTVNKATGFADEMGKGRSANIRNAASATLFAPKYREAVIGQLANAIKGWAPQNLKDPSYRYSRRFAVGLLGTAALYDQANVHLTGHHMWENRKGQELSLQIPTGEKDAKGNTPVINIPLFPSTLTVPRAVIQGVIGGLRGDTKEVGTQATKFLATPLQVGGQVLTNKDYFSRPIVSDSTVAQTEGVPEDSNLQKAEKRGIYLSKQLAPGWIRAGIDQAGGKPLSQNLAQAFEAPVRFGKDLNPETTAYFDSLDKAKKTLNKNELAAYQSLHPTKKNSLGNQIYEAETVYNPAGRLDIYNRFPKVFEADKQVDAVSRKQGNLGNPLFDQQPWQVKKILEKDNLPPGASDPELSKLRDQPWYQDYQTKKSAYFSAVNEKLKSQGKSLAASDNPYPATPPDLQKVMDYYSNLPKGSGARSGWIKSNLGLWNSMQDQFAKIDNWQNIQRGKRGLDSTEGATGVAAGYGTQSSGYSSKPKSINPADYIKKISVKTPKSTQPKVSIKKVVARARKPSSGTISVKVKKAAA